MFAINLKAICTATIIFRLLLVACVLFLTQGSILFTSNIADASNNFQRASNKSKLLNSSSLKILCKKSFEKKLGIIAKYLEKQSHVGDDTIFLSAVCEQVKANKKVSQTKDSDVLQNIVAYSTILESDLASRIAGKALTCYNEGGNIAKTSGSNTGENDKGDAIITAESKIYLAIASILDKLDDDSVLDRFLAENYAIFSKISNDISKGSSPASSNIEKR